MYKNWKFPRLILGSLFTIKTVFIQQKKKVTFSNQYSPEI